MLDYLSGLSQQVIAGLIVAAIAAIVAGVPFARWLSRKRLSRGPEEKINILLAKLEGDVSGTIQQTLRECISKNLHNGVAIITLDESIKLGAGLHEQAEAEAQQLAHNLLKRKNADLLVWGRLKSTDVVSLRFTPAEQQYTQPQTYTLTQDSLELPTDFISHLGIAIAAYATSTLDRTADRKPEMLPALETLGGRLENLIANPSADFDASTIATLYHCSARVKVRRYDLTGDDKDLRDSIIQNREALKRRDRVHHPVDWAKTQNNLGSCLARLGERTGVLAYFDEAKSALEDALDEHLKDAGAFIRVAATRMNIANILIKRGQRETTRDSLKLAATMLEQLSTKELRSDDPELYAGIQNNRGLTLMLLGEGEVDLRNLNKALEALGESLEIRTKEKAPFDWACTKVNMAATLVQLGERTGELAIFQSAIEDLHDALRIIRRSQNPRLWAMAQNNLGIAQIVVANEQNEQMLRDAISSISDALRITRREDDPLLWNAAQTTLGRAQTQLGYITEDVELLRKALVPFHAVFAETSVQSSKVAKWYVSNEYGFAILNLSEHDPSFIEEGRQLFETLSDDLAPVAGPDLRWVRAMMNLGRSERLKGEQVGDPTIIRKSIETLSSCLKTFSAHTHRAAWIGTQFLLAKSYLAPAQLGPTDEAINGCRKHCGEALSMLRNEPGNLLVRKIHEILDRLDELTNSC